MSGSKGLANDLALMEQRARERRRVLNWLVAGGSAVALAACGGGGDSSTTSSSSGSSGSGSGSGSGTTTSGTCTAVASETNGPYPSDGSNTVNGMVSNVLQQSGVVRSDIRSSFGSSTTTAPGVPLTMTITLSNSNNNCALLAGYAVYLWHCDRAGLYSLYSNGVQNENYLRGVQVADANGQVTFTTIFPGCYAGRYPHFHFEVYPSLAMATNYTNRTYTSQLALPRDICTTVYSNATGYSTSLTNLGSSTIANDNVFGDNTTAQNTAMTLAMSGSVAAGYTGSASVGIPV